MPDITTIIWDGPCAVTESHAGIALGYYVDCDTAHCRNCIPDASAWARGEYVGWPGFEGWEEPAVIFNDTESDTPTHCGICRAVIRHDLTSEGAAYVMEAIAEFIEGDGHTPDVMAQWWDAYGEDEYALDHGDLTEIIRRAMVARGCTEFIPGSSDQSETEPTQPVQAEPAEPTQPVQAEPTEPAQAEPEDGHGHSCPCSQCQFRRDQQRRGF